MFKHHKNKTHNQTTQPTNNSSQSLFNDELNNIKQNNPYYKVQDTDNGAQKENIYQENRRTQRTNNNSSNKQKPKHKNIFVRVIIIIIILVIILLVGLILNLTIKRTNAINESKEQDAAQTAKYTETVSQKKARQEFDNKYNSIVTGNNNTDIKPNVTTQDVKYLSSRIDKLSPSCRNEYQRKFNHIKTKMNIQIQFNKFFVNNTIDSKAVKDNVTPNEIFKFNNKYDGQINRIYQNNNNDEFARRINSEQLRLTNDASAILDIYTQTSSLYTQLGDKANNWTFKLNNNVIPDKGQLTDQNLDVLNKENNNGSKIKLQLISDIQSKINNLAFNWGNRLDLVKQLLNLSHNAAIDNYNNVVDAINAALEKQKKDNNAKNDDSKKPTTNNSINMPQNTYSTPTVNANSSSPSSQDNNSDNNNQNNNQNNNDNTNDNSSSQNNDSDNGQNNNDQNNQDNQTMPDDGPDATNAANHF